MIPGVAFTCKMAQTILLHNNSFWEATFSFDFQMAAREKIECTGFGAKYGRKRDHYG